MKSKQIAEVLAELASKYPKEMVVGQIQDIPRITFHIATAIYYAKAEQTRDLTVCDIGGGMGLFSLGCAALGVKRMVLVDDFNDSFNHLSDNAALALHGEYGVEIICRDAVSEGLSGVNGPFDIVTTFDSMEHWHHSPRKLFHEVVTKLRPGGVFMLGVPNCVNLRKRITVPFGHGKWSAIQHWYDEEVFRGHVREPDVSDLKYIARDIGLQNVQILGRNWLGYSSPDPWIRAAAMVFDYPLRMSPTLCSDIYLIGEK